MIWDFFMEYKNKDRIGFFLFLILFSVFLMFLVSAQSNPRILFSNESLISSSNNSTQRVMYPSVATDSQRNVHIIWMKEFSLIGEIFYSKLDKDGNLLIDNRQLSNFSGVHGFTSDIAVDRWDNVHIIWDYDKTGTSLHGSRYTRLDSLGNIVVDGVLLPRNTLGSKLVLDSQGDLHLTNGFIYQKFDNLGNALTQEVILGNFTQWEPLESGIVVDSNDNAHIVWMEESINNTRNPDSRIKYSKIDNNGSFVVSDTQLDIELNYSYSPSIAVDKQDSVYISWHSGQGNFESNYLSKINKNGTFSIDRKQFISRNIGNGVIGVDPLGNINFIGDGHSFLQLNSTGDLVVGPFISAIWIGSSAPRITIDRQGGIHYVWHVYNNDLNRYWIMYRKSLNPATISLTGVPKIGSKVDFEIEDIYGVNTSYYFGLSLGNLPGMNLADGRNVPLNDDYILRSSLGSPNNMGLVNSVGRLDSNNQATISFNIPNISSLNGTRLYGSFITVDSQNRIISIADSIEFTVV